MARTRLLAVPVALSVAGTAAMGQSPGRGFSPTGTYTDYALTNVRIVTAPGKVIERGTVVVRDGRIAAVGASVTVPAGVVRMDLAGNSVYPGLIDAATSVGLPSPTRELAAQTVAQAGAAGGGRGGRGGGAAPGGGRGIPLPNGAAAPPAPPIVLPELDADAEAADMFAPTADQLTAFRTAGVTTVGLVFNGGIFPGRVGAALTGSRNDGRLGLRSSAGQEIAFGTKRGGAYPSVGIGSYAFIRQSILDAQYESRLDKAFKAGTPGGRPANDPFWREYLSRFEQFAKTESAQPGIDLEVAAVLFLAGAFIWPVWARACGRDAAERKRMAERFQRELLRLCLHGTLKPEKLETRARR